jgi:hypothetical protein
MVRPPLAFGRLALAFAVLLAFAASSAAQPQETATPPRPPEGDIQDKARRLWDAIVRDDPALAADAFFPREPFLQIKNMRDPGRYYDKLRARFDADIHALHASTPDLDRATFERLELAKRGGYVRVREEGNRLPYWASRHSRLHYRVGKALRALDVRVIIAWQDAWYVIHLSPF